MQFTSKLIVALLVAVPSASLAGPQSAIEIHGIKKVGESFVIEVPYRDLDLRQPAQVRELSARVDRAAQSVCSPRLYPPWLDAAQEHACTEGAIADAAPQMAMARKRAEEFARNGFSALPEVAIAVRTAF